MAWDLAIASEPPVVIRAARLFWEGHPLLHGVKAKRKNTFHSLNPGVPWDCTLGGPGRNMVFWNCVLKFCNLIYIYIYNKKQKLNKEDIDNKRSKHK